MNQQQGILRKACLSMLALLLLADVSWAAGIGFRNDTRYTIIVQGSTTAGGMLRRGPALIIPPGKTAWDNYLAPGTQRMITIFDGDQGNAVLHRDTILFQGQNLFFSVQPGPPSPGQAKGVQMKG